MRRLMPTPTQINAARTPKGGWTKATLAEWGVSWPPPKGWRQRLIAEAEANLPVFGEWRLTDLRPGQCRFACTAHDVPRDQHRFCGRPAPIGPGNLHGSWCDEHRRIVFGEGTVSERAAGQFSRETAA